MLSTGWYQFQNNLSYDLVRAECVGLPSDWRPQLGLLTAAGPAIGVQGVALTASAGEPLLQVGTLVLTAGLVQCTVIDP